jgi:hypothetical protein
MIIKARYNGPPDSANGGWSAGVVAGELPGPSEVTLRVPPPLETEFSVEHYPDSVQVYAPDGTLVANAYATEVPREPLVPMSFDEAVEVSAKYPGFISHPFPTCFGCGPDREPGDGLRLFPGRYAEGRTATPWIVPDDVSATMLWTALDCPGGWTVGVETRPFLLGRMAAHVDAVPEPGTRCVIIGALLEMEGRKARVATTVFGADGTPYAWALATWISIG